MADPLTCPQGHRWEPDPANPPPDPHRPAVCPVCGDPARGPAPGGPAAPTITLEEDGIGQKGVKTVSLGGAPPPVQAVDSIGLAGPRTQTPPGALTQPVAGPARREAEKKVERPTDVPGYEILGILGRGGMGIVYRALQTALKRTVALKMIIAGAHASPSQLARFRAEAEAVARLQHPHIVQIHEVGEHESLPFFSLEF